jgi:hypothetical protein
MPPSTLSPNWCAPVPGSRNAAEGLQVTATRNRARCLRRGMVAVVAAAALCPALLTGPSAAAAGWPPAGAGAGISGGAWGRAEKVPGLGALGGDSGLRSVSCVSAGNCSAGGYYTAGSAQQVFVVSQKDGAWGKAEEVPGIAALNTGEDAEIWSVSCASAGNCSAGGGYTSRPFLTHGFVVSQKNGIWGKARKVSGAVRGNGINSVSCASAGNCSAGGIYTDHRGHWQAFVVSQKRGTWGQAERVPGTGGDAGINSVSCAAAGRCSAGGFFLDHSANQQAFVVSQTR